MGKPFPLPDSWTRFACLDYGLDMTACLWLAYPPDHSRIVVYRELYCPDLILSEAAARIREANGGDRLKYVVASPDLGGRRQDSGKTGFDILRSYGLSGLIPAQNERIIGWRRLREFLAAEGKESPYLQIFPACTNLLRTLPRLCFDPNNTEDVASTPHELTHAPDALRYGLMSLPFLPATPAPRPCGAAPSLSESFFKEKKNKTYLDFLRK